MGSIMITPEVSVVIPSYNGSKTIERALKSIAFQSYSNYEIVIVDDGSSDDTKKKVRDFKKKYAAIEVKYIEQSNQGPSSSRNKGVQCARGAFIAFLDVDDEWHKDKLEVQIKIMKDRYLNFLGSDYQYIDFNNENTSKVDIRRYSFDSLLFKNRFSTSGVVISKDLFLDLKGFDESFKYSEDYDLWLRVALNLNLEIIKYPKLIKRHRSIEGLSSNIYSMLKGELVAIKKLLISGNIGHIKYVFITFFIFLKFLKRYLMNINKQGVY